MSSRAKSAESEVASALKARVDLSLVAEAESDGPMTLSNRAHNKSAIGTRRAHNKSAVDAPVVPTGEARARALELASLLASSHSGQA